MDTEPIQLPLFPETVALTAGTNQLAFWIAVGAPSDGRPYRDPGGRFVTSGLIIDTEGLRWESPDTGAPSRLAGADVLSVNPSTNPLRGIGAAG